MSTKAYFLPEDFPGFITPGSDSAAELLEITITIEEGESFSTCRVINQPHHFRLDRDGQQDDVMLSLSEQVRIKPYHQNTSIKPRVVQSYTSSS